MLVLGLCGSLRQGSHNRRLLVAAQAVLGGGVRFCEWRGLDRLPAYNADLDQGHGPAEVAELRRAISSADALLIATPEYNHSIPGALKNGLDWASRPFPDNAVRGKPVAVIGASTSLFGAVWAQAETRKVLAAMGARVVDEELAVAGADEAFAADGSLADPGLSAHLDRILEQLLAEASPPAARAA